MTDTMAVWMRLYTEQLKVQNSARELLHDLFKDGKNRSYDELSVGVELMGTALRKILDAKTLAFAEKGKKRVSR